ncbi:MAG: SLC13 family permease [Verrucomicrobiales bacterium]|nr:SLC13 family permease [Verrucomicrobiales bacterium]
MTGETLRLILVFVLLAAVFVAFVKEWCPPDLTALGALAILILTGTLGEKDIAGIFANNAPLTIGAMFVLSAALTRTGAIERIARFFTHTAGKSEMKALLLLAAIVIPLSAFLNNTPIVVVFLPVLLGFARASGLKASRLLIPLSFFSILGGTVTLIGTSTNILVSGVAVEQGQPPFTIFEISKMGLIYALIGGAYLLFFGKKLLPDRDTLSSLLSTEDTRSFYTHAVILENSTLVGKAVAETALGKSRSIRIFEVIREGHRIDDTPIDELVLRPDDLLVLTAPSRGIAAIQEMNGLDFGSESHSETPTNPASLKLVEAIVGPQSDFIGQTIRELGFRRRYGVRAAAVHRRGTNLTENFLDVPLRFGDTVIFEGPEQNLAKMQEDDDFLSLNETREKPFRRDKAPIAIGAILVVVLLSAFDIMPISLASLVAATVVVLTRCLDPKEVYHSVEWSILFIIFGMLGLGKAMETTGAAALIVGASTDVLKSLGPLAVLAAIYLIASIVTEVVTNNAVAILLTPIAIGIAESMQVDPRPFIVAVMFGASASFMTPIGYQTNTYVFGAGGYRFSDFPRIGVPLNLILWGVAVVCIPIFWPFHP